LDDNDIERERGITIKAKAIALDYIYNDQKYLLNLIDTPGHVDFGYEVLRSLKACEGALLLVDATQGVQAQTVANTLLAIESNLHLVPLINKIDAPLAHSEEVKEEMKNVLSIKPEDITLVSAKTGENVALVLERVIKEVPPPRGSASNPTQALIFDSVYDAYRGVVVYVRVINGILKQGEEIIMINSKHEFKVEEVGIFKPKMVECKELKAGEVGYVMSGIKNLRDVKIGDTIGLKKEEGVQPLIGYKDPIPMVFCGIYPSTQSTYKQLQTAMERLSLNDSSFQYEVETSEALGYGFRCGFLGLLHMEIIQERLNREEGVEVIQTAPNVTYEILVREAGGIVTLRIDNPARFPDEGVLVEIREPVVRLSIIIPSDTIGTMMHLCELRRGRMIRTEYISTTRVILTYDIPLAEIIYDFYDKLKSATRGYGTMDYSFMGYEVADLVKLKILVAGMEVDALSVIIHRDGAEPKGRRILQLLRKEIPRHLFEVALQAGIGKKIIARENIKPYLKNVTGKCYGGDITRKRKLWEKQKEGKKKMKSIGRVEIPQKAFLTVLSTKED
jgi:GTP-binding protein LepA